MCTPESALPTAPHCGAPQKELASNTGTLPGVTPMPAKPSAILLVIFLFAAAACAQQPGPPPSIADLPPVTPPNRPAIGIALEGGGALGLAHVGVLQWLEEHHIPIDRISGTSMGALVAALYATGRTPADMRAVAVGNDMSSVFTLQTPYSDLSYRRRQDRREIPLGITIGLKNRSGLRNALLTDRGVNAFLSRELFSYNSPDLNYDRLPIPFRCVATDLNTLQTLSFSGGPLPEAVRASISIPGIFPPAQGRDGHFLVDGGILDNLPTDVLRNELHADTIIAVRLQDAALSPADTGSIIGVLDRAFTAGIVNNVDQSQKLADAVINVPVGSFSGTDYTKAAQLIDAGYKAADDNKNALLHYALNDADWQAYIDARDARRLPAPGIVRTVRVAASNPPIEPGAVREVEHDMKPAEGRPASSGAILNGLKGVQSNEVYEATYETIAQPGFANNLGPDTGILIHLQKDPKGPPYLLVGPEGVASTSNVTQGEVALRFIDQNLGGYGSEFRASARIGYMTALSAEYYRQITPSGFFMQPNAGIIREPIYIWANQKRIAERFQQNLDAGLEAGRTFNNQFQIAAQWRAEDMHWALRTGSDGGGYIAGTAHTGMLRFTLDREASGTVSPNGFRISAAAGALYHAVASDNAPLVNVSFSHSNSWGGTNIFGISGDVNSYLRARVADPFRFTLGGPMRLSASSIDEYRGTDTYLARSGYLHRIAALPTGLGQGLYAGVAYEAGEIWSPDQRAILRQDGTTGLVAATPLGVITIGVSVGDAGHRKVFLTIGRWF